MTKKGLHVAGKLLTKKHTNVEKTNNLRVIGTDGRQEKGREAEEHQHVHGGVDVVVVVVARSRSHWHDLR